MKVCVAPASTKTGEAAIDALLEDPSGPSVVGVYRDLSKVPERFKTHTRFEARRGDVASAASLDFSGCDALITATPPLYFSPSGPIQGAREVSSNVKVAVKDSNINRLVYISSCGAQYASGVVCAQESSICSVWGLIMVVTIVG